MRNKLDVVGLIPAGGIATRLGKIPVSKELFPFLLQGDTDKISVISENLLRYYKNAGITDVYFILRKGKWDIPEYYGDGSELGMNIGYLMMNLPYGTSFTLNQAYPFIKDKTIALGFPDMIVEPEDCFSPLLQQIDNDNADVVLGVFPIATYQKWDMIEFDEQKNIKNIVIKQDRPDLHYGWSIAVWNPSFTKYINDFLTNQLKNRPDGTIEFPGNHIREIYMGDIIQDALFNGMKIDYVKFENGNCIDIGTPDDLKKYIRLTFS
jgi:glucose-1-phosphate thymidylyltransferase